MDKEWEKLEKLPARQMTKVKSESEVIQEAQKEQRTVHFATLMDICLLKDAEYCGEDNLKKVLWGLGWEKVPNWECLVCASKSRSIPICIRG